MRAWFASALLASSSVPFSVQQQQQQQQPSAEEYSGVFVRRNHSGVQLGELGDVSLTREDGEAEEGVRLVVQADRTVVLGDLHINGTLTADNLQQLAGSGAAWPGSGTSGGAFSWSGWTGDGGTFSDAHVGVEYLGSTNGTVLHVDPSASGGCPAELGLSEDSSFNFGRGLSVCSRNLTASGARAFYYEVPHAVGTIDIDLTYHQYYSADGFYSGSGATVESDVFCEGVTFAVINALGERQHVFTASVGYSRGASYTSYNCPSRNCNYADQSYCTGPNAPLWMGDAFSCDSGNTATSGVAATWFGGMDAAYTAAVRMEEGDLLEVRLMADQASSNEDVGLSSLRVSLSPEKGYPYSGADTGGWVLHNDVTDTADTFIFGIDPAVNGFCPGDLVLHTGYGGAPVCTRQQSGGGAVSALIESPFDAGTITIEELSYNQYYSADAFNSDAGADIDDTYFMEGVSIAWINDVDERTHVYSFAVGIAYDTNYTSYNCPRIGCGYPDARFCAGPAAHPWQGKNVYCNSKNSGTWEATWYPPMGPADPLILGTRTISEGDSIEVRLMADQASSNEDVGITSLVMSLQTAQSFPYDDGNGWVIFERDLDSGLLVFGIDPSVGGRCPGGFTLEEGYRQVPLCSRALSAAGNVEANYEAPFDVGTVQFEISYNQYYSADAFNGDAGADIDDSVFMEGVSIAAVDSVNARSHLFSAAVGISFDVSYTSYNCPPYQCGYPDKSFCTGPAALPWLGAQFYCSSKNRGTWEAKWYAPMGPSSPVVVGLPPSVLSEGDSIEVRAMADQAASNEDVGITQLKITLKEAATYPMDDGTGWVHFEAPVEGERTVVGIDPRVGGRCPGTIVVDNGYHGIPICTRNLDSAGNRAATYKLTHDVSSITLNMTYAQHYSADGFASAADSSIDDSYFMEGVHIAVLSAADTRSHIFAYAVGINYDSGSTSYSCPSGSSCGYDDSDYCAGPSAPSFVGTAFYCDSGNSGTWESVWYSPMQAPVFQIDVDLAEGEVIEIRAMADQASSNEDVGIQQLVMALEA